RCKINTNVLKYILYRYIIKKNWKGVDRMASTIQVRVDDDIKTKADVLFKDLGMDTTTAIRIFLVQAIANDGFPFEIKKKTVNPYRTLSESEFMDKLETSRMHAKQGDYRDADDVIAEMRNRYGL
ncbi:type II toxin-antitoxin system RelB/DinJ family antitoxin, partial [Eubacterium ramulus]|uniref:type II toxin-antitoxin system RelB/DinJ family antitoxin n=2 Tax=Eubacterium ramulus TaxID=39490 RepID=UPI0030B90D89